ERLAVFLTSVYAALETGGCWIFQLVNWDYLLSLKEYTFPVKTLAPYSIEFHRRYSLISAEQVVFEVQLNKRGKIVFKEQSRLYPLTSEVLLKLHAAAGFSLEGIFSGFDKSGFSSSRNSGLIMVFTKKNGA
ncbi:MAG: class I SAM-dependent methyltransferase, partial [Chlorobiaceae bacterium]|nr:class I SAM-dependent methyltransferase [Chlorobiaceae bacterium]